MKGERATEIWAVLNNDGSVRWTNGGSSTQQRLMVYPSEISAQRGVRSSQMVNVRIEKVYTAPTRED